MREYSKIYFVPPPKKQTFNIYSDKAAKHTALGKTWIALCLLKWKLYTAGEKEWKYK